MTAIMKTLIITLLVPVVAVQLLEGSMPCTEGLECTGKSNCCSFQNCIAIDEPEDKKAVRETEDGEAVEQTEDENAVEETDYVETEIEYPYGRPLQWKGKCYTDSRLAEPKKMWAPR